MMAQEHGTYVDKYIYRHKPHIEEKQKPKLKKKFLITKTKDLDRQRERALMKTTFYILHASI